MANYSDLGKDIFIKKSDDFEYKLVGKNDLPEDYVAENDSDVEITLSSFSKYQYLYLE